MIIQRKGEFIFTLFMVTWPESQEWQVLPCDHIYFLQQDSRKVDARSNSRVRIQKQLTNSFQIPNILKRGLLKIAGFEQVDSAGELNRTYFFFLNLNRGANRHRWAYGEG